MSVERWRKIHRKSHGSVQTCPGFSPEMKGGVPIYIRKNTQLPPFVPLPKFILHTELSLNAKLLYGLLLNRSMLSQKNDWVDQNGHVFVIYTIRQMAEDLDRSQRTVKNALNELENAGLLLRVRQGFQQANRIFVLLPDSAPQTGKCCPPEVQDPAHHEGQNLPPSNTEEYKDLRKTERVSAPPLGHYQNVFLTEGQREELQKDFPGRLDDYVEKLSAYMAQSGKDYACHEAVLRRWLTEDRPEGRKGNYTDADYAEGEYL